jgi:hypothetical protein
MISSEVTLLFLLLLLCIVVSFVSYWKGVAAGEASKQERIEQLLDDLDYASEAMRVARERHPAGRELRVVRDDAS